LAYRERKTKTQTFTSSFLLFFLSSRTGSFEFNSTTSSGVPSEIKGRQWRLARRQCALRPGVFDGGIYKTQNYSLVHSILTD
jgi:hypothetical protein